jgi:hypothetical protein
MDNPEMRNVIEGALTYLRTHGWIKGSSLDVSTGKVCTVGAVCYSLAEANPVYDLGVAVNAISLLRSKLPSSVYSYPETDIAAYNDDPNTTQQDIENLFEKTIADL